MREIEIEVRGYEAVAYYLRGFGNGARPEGVEALRAVCR